MMEYIFAALAAGIVWVLAPYMVAFCTKRGLVAAITARSLHAKPMPHGGGIILPLIVVPLGLVWVGVFNPPYAMFLTVLLLASLAVAYIGWRDDHTDVSPLLRMLVHLAAVGVALVFLPPLFDIFPQQWVAPVWAEKILLLLAWGWFVSLYNFMDGADGLASSQAVFLGLGVALLYPPLAPLALMIAASASAFLRVNAPPARIFMGDGCSTWLGFMFGGLLALAAADNTWQYLWPALTLPLVFCADATSTLVRRLAQGYKPWVPHKTFWFHRALALGLSHGQLLVAVAGLNVLLLALALVSLHSGWAEVGFVGGILLMVGTACYIRSLEKAKP
jgi:UDP-N-acetylmuramyl pentapeptide phosphotransferase/UDP-N-acetylglucosamine-1-phosphate transferase